MALADTELQILDFEAEFWRTGGSKERAVRERFGMSATRYYQVVNRLLDEPAALAHSPQLVHRLRAARERRLVKPR
ncbi:DUF3263 domain-containing protein [Georgenia sp. MJ206]|uniref:DUF3263 domain-containing protein n=1 Tax=Georgenia wangjunii TaxID=3117730 RepID=UPI002F26A734